MHVKRIHLERTGSTNRTLFKLLKSGSVREEVAVIAGYQQHGRGQGDHGWHSNPGENLLMSLLLFPAFLSASCQFHLSRVASLALCDTLKKLKLPGSFNPDPVIKWPNDILVGGRKIAGILIEHGITGSKLSHTIMGIGLNVNQERFPDFPVEATSLVLEGHARMDLTGVTDSLLESIQIRYSQLESGAFRALEQEYLEHLFLLDRPGEYISGGVKFTGIIRGVNEFGELLVERDGKTGSYGFQEIRFVMHSTV
ncbi:MAG: biotin--[acetyl-CoA-carboxylase] ligase [Bacteroidota bacterium]